MIRRADLIPTLFVIALAIGPPSRWLPDEDPCPAPSDGPQFACWLEDQ